MKIVAVKWKNRKSVVTIDTPFCDECEGEMKYVGSAGCSHNDEFTYFIQCESCKKVETTYSIPDSMRDIHKNLGSYGWKKVEELLPK